MFLPRTPTEEMGRPDVVFQEAPEGVDQAVGQLLPPAGRPGLSSHLLGARGGGGGGVRPRRERPCGQFCEWPVPKYHLSTPLPSAGPPPAREWMEEL